MFLRFITFICIIVQLLVTTSGVSKFRGLSQDKRKEAKKGNKRRRKKELRVLWPCTSLHKSTDRRKTVPLKACQMVGVPAIGREPPSHHTSQGERGGQLDRPTDACLVWWLRGDVNSPR
jgi:hypothetical protein